MAALEGWRLIGKVEKVILGGLFLSPAAALTDYFVVSLPRGVVGVCAAISLMCVSLIIARDANIWEREPEGKAQDKTAK